MVRCSHERKGAHLCCPPLCGGSMGAVMISCLHGSVVALLLSTLSSPPSWRFLPCFLAEHAVGMHLVEARHACRHPPPRCSAHACPCSCYLGKRRDDGGVGRFFHHHCAVPIVSLWRFAAAPGFAAQRWVGQRVVSYAALAVLFASHVSVTGYDASGCYAAFAATYQCHTASMYEGALTVVWRLAPAPHQTAKTAARTVRYPPP